MKVLVSAASRHGSTEEIAQVIAGILARSDLEVDVLPPDQVERIDGYDAVVLGSAVYAGHWLAPAKAFVERHEAELRERPVFLFSSGPLGVPPRPIEDPVDAGPIEAATGAIDHQVFGGRLMRSRLSMPSRVAIAFVQAPDGDFRPWDDIGDWATAIARYLLGQTADVPAVSRSGAS